MIINFIFGDEETESLIRNSPSITSSFVQVESFYVKQMRSLIPQDRIFRNEQEDQERKKERIYADTQIRGTRRKSQMRTGRGKERKHTGNKKGGMGEG